MTTKRKTKRANRPDKQGAIRGKNVSPLNGAVLPVEKQFKPGVSGNPHGRPRKLREFQELIYDVMAEDLLPDLSRIRAAIRLGLNKNPTPFLEYAFGKVPQQIEMTIYDSLAARLGVSQQEARDIAARVARGEFTIEDVMTGKIKVNADDNASG